MLYWAYGIPIFLNFRNKIRRKGEYTTQQTAPWNLKKWGAILNAISVVWILLITVFLVMPPNELVLWTAVLICVFMFAYWHLDVKKRFKGPTPLDNNQFSRLEAETADRSVP
jgi:amino acid transporter